MGSTALYLTAGTATDMPRLLFKDGITTITNVTASTNVGIMVILSLTDKGAHYFEQVLGATKANQMHYVFQQLLCYWVWLKKEFHWKGW